MSAQPQDVMNDDAKEIAEIEVIEKFLPQQLSAADVEAKVKAIIAHQ